MTRKIEIYDTTLRDSAHTLRKAALKGEEVAPLAELVDAVGFPAADVWGGATFDNCLRLIGEDPWERLQLLAGRFHRTPLRMLVRGQCLLAYRPLPMDVITAFAKSAAAFGLRRARVFDPLNDTDNLEVVIKELCAAGFTVEGCLVYTQSPVHSVPRFLADAERLVALGCCGVNLMDIAGILTPNVAREFVAGLAGRIPVTLHARSTTGMAAMAYQAGLEAGALGVDCAIGPFGISSNLPTVEAMVESLSGTDLDPGLDLKALRAYSKRAESITMQHAMSQSDRQIMESAISVHKISVGMLAGLVDELKALNAQHRLGEVLAEVTRIREDFGWPPLIAPISPMISAQAIQNVVHGKRYGIMARDTVNYLKGLYGQPPGEINSELLKGQSRVSGRAAHLLPPMMEAATTALEKEKLLDKPEDVITYALFGQVAMAFLRQRRNPAQPRRSARTVDPRLQVLTSFMARRGLARLEIGDKDFRVKLVKRQAVAARPAAPGEAAAAARPAMQGEPIPAPLSGIFYRASGPNLPPFAEAGSEIQPGTVIGLIEAMKLFHEVKAEAAGRINAFAVESGDSVEEGRALAYFTPANA